MSLLGQGRPFSLPRCSSMTLSSDSSHTWERGCSCPSGTDGGSTRTTTYRNRANDFWLRIINAGGDEPTEESRRLRRRLLVQAGMHDPRDGGPDEEPLE